MLLILGRVSNCVSRAEIIEFGKIEYECKTVKKSTGSGTTEKRLYVTSLPANTPRLGTPVRNHWSIELSLIHISEPTRLL